MMTEMTTIKVAIIMATHLVNINQMRNCVRHLLNQGKKKMQLARALLKRQRGEKMQITRQYFTYGNF